MAFSVGGWVSGDGDWDWGRARGPRPYEGVKSFVRLIPSFNQHSPTIRGHFSTSSQRAHGVACLAVSVAVFQGRSGTLHAVSCCVWIPLPLRLSMWCEALLDCEVFVAGILPLTGGILGERAACVMKSDRGDDADPSYWLLPVTKTLGRNNCYTFP